MKAIIQRRYGPPEVLELTDIAKPAVRRGEVLIRVRAAAVNPADWHVMRGLPYIARLAFRLRTPKARVRVTDLAGQVEATGPGVTRFARRRSGWAMGSQPLKSPTTDTAPPGSSAGSV